MVSQKQESSPQQ